MRPRLRRALLPLALAALAAAASAQAQSRAFGLRVSWANGSGCSGQSPPVTLSNVPGGTAKLGFKMVDLDLPSYDHGGGEVSFSGKTSFAAGELFGFFSSYRGPCPPPGTTHRYQWTVTAMDAAGRELGSARTQLLFKR